MLTSGQRTWMPNMITPPKTAAYHAPRKQPMLFLPVIGCPVGLQGGFYFTTDENQAITLVEPSYFPCEIDRTLPSLWRSSNSATPPLHLPGSQVRRPLPYGQHRVPYTVQIPF